MRFRQGLVSVCLPVHNGDRYLDGAIESILGQTYRDLELIIVDDFSTDHSHEIIESYAARDPRINHFRNARRMGLYETFNQCLAQANGQFIKPFSQDDLLRSQALAKCVHQLILEPTAALATVGYEIMDARSNLLKGVETCGTQDVFQQRTLVAASEVLDKCLFPLTNHLGEVSSIMFRAQHQGTGFDSRLHQFAEIDFWMRILMQGDYIAIPETYAYVRHHLGSNAVTNSRNLMGAGDLIKIARKYSRVIEACGRSEEEFLDQSIAAFIARLDEQLTDGSITAQRLRKADDLRVRAAIASAHEANASTTQAFSLLASALAEGDVSCVAFTPQPTEAATEMLQDLIDFREFAFHAIRLLANGGLPRPMMASGMIEESGEDMTGHEAVAANTAVANSAVAAAAAGGGTLDNQNQQTQSNIQAEKDEIQEDIPSITTGSTKAPPVAKFEDDYRDITIFEISQEELDNFPDLQRKKKTIIDQMLSKR